MGAADEIFHDVAAARAAGHPDLPVPPTYLFCLELEREGLAGIGVSLDRVLHVEQGFEYHELAHAGDRITFAPVVVSIRSHRRGRLELITTDTAVTRADGAAVADLHQVLAVRHAEGTP
ncbi:hypothetical protein Ahu01nite_061630 [Winogradskya humida]|uniref:FAS1-like dehydratase domain-containing protein n=1 Tax=Winogradskya humida TaxID=113566 RepID=A0ABQ3ZWU8_9ACTN|nr:hypothetical protein Ahu01nite_061630 [Actinoplanes humidus]